MHEEIISLYGVRCLVMGCLLGLAIAIMCGLGPQTSFPVYHPVYIKRPKEDDDPRD